jgi:hypothetical protein
MNKSSHSIFFRIPVDDRLLQSFPKPSKSCPTPTNVPSTTEKAVTQTLGHRCPLADLEEEAWEEEEEDSTEEAGRRSTRRIYSTRSSEEALVGEEGSVNLRVSFALSLSLSLSLSLPNGSNDAQRGKEGLTLAPPILPLAFSFGSGGFNQPRVYRTQTRHQQPRRAADGPPPSIWVQLLPLLFILAFSLISFLPSLLDNSPPTPSFAYEPHPPAYTNLRTTAKNGVAYYVDNAFKEHPIYQSVPEEKRGARESVYSSKLRGFENDVEMGYARQLQGQCSMERSRRDEKIRIASGFFGIGSDWEEVSPWFSCLGCFVGQLVGKRWSADASPLLPLRRWQVRRLQRDPLVSCERLQKMGLRTQNVQYY